MNKKGQLLGNFLIWVMLFIIIVLSAPMLFDAVGIGVAGTGGFSGFVVASFPWVILLVFVLVGISLFFGRDEIV